ncbi:DUF4105 domain-containing protein [Lysobacter koreensis]|uniref:DUF4105 domain-containing protein n=1 Tax=Lysobacter koreensis TaxID=266122 RepID=A0ABW2YS54_9GAMM
MLRLLLACLMWLGAATVLAAPPAATAQAPAPRIGVVTMQPGEIFFERFGHNAVLVQDPASGTATSYNFGFFDPGESDFIARFVRGDMRYRLVALPLEDDLAYYQQVGRGVALQWLALDDSEARALAAALAQNARPENAHYRYDYFLDNCSTRVRDAIDRALGGELRRQSESRSHGSTYRSEALRLASPAPWMWLGFDIGLGPDADRPLSVWAESFVPMRLADALRETRAADRTPVVRAAQPLLPHTIAPEPQDAPIRWWPWALAGLAIGAGLLALGRRKPRVLAAVVLPLWLLCGVVGALLLFIWFGTDHRIGWQNHNLLLFNPLCWLLLPGAWTLLRGRTPRRWFGITLVAVVACAVIALFANWLPLLPQRNAHWIALLLPIHAALAWTWGRRRP